MGYWTSTIECTFCDKKFEAKRRDAKFCSPKCRTANNRREAKREKAAIAMTEQWDEQTEQKYNTIVKHVPAAKEMFLDMVSSDGTQITAEAVNITSVVLEAVLYQMNNKIDHKERTIEHLQKSVTKLEEIRAILNGR